MMPESRPTGRLLSTGRTLLALHVGLFALFGIGEVVTDPGGWRAAVTIAVILGLGLAVAVLALRRPGAATTTLMVLFGIDALAFAVPALDRVWDRIGPAPLALALIILAGAVALSGRRPEPAGWLAVAVAALLLGRFMAMLDASWWMALNGLAILAGPPLVGGAMLLAGARQGTRSNRGPAGRPKHA